MNVRLLAGAEADLVEGARFLESRVPGTGRAVVVACEDEPAANHRGYVVLGGRPLKLKVRLHLCVLMQIAETDWKRLRQVKELALERLCASILDECQAIILREGSTSHERYLALYRHIHDRDKDVAEAFNGLSRSTGLDRLATMCALGLITDQELAEFSAETQQKVQVLLGFFEGA